MSSVRVFSFRRTALTTSKRCKLYFYFVIPSWVISVSSLSRLPSFLLISAVDVVSPPPSTRAAHVSASAPPRPACASLQQRLPVCSQPECESLFTSAQTVNIISIFFRSLFPFLCFPCYQVPLQRPQKPWVFCVIVGGGERGRGGWLNEGRCASTPLSANPSPLSSYVHPPGLGDLHETCRHSLLVLTFHLFV